MAEIYLKLENRVGEESSTAELNSDVIKQNTENASFNLISNIVACKVSATTISYDMGMYEPDHFTVTLHLSSDDNIPVTLVAKQLIGLRATMFYSTGTTGDVDVELAKNLFVYRAIPTSRKMSGSTSSNVYVTLEIYSADKLLDLKKFSQTFTGKALGTIIDDELSKYVPTELRDGKKADKYVLGLSSNKQILDYKLSASATDKNEAIQPYLVQYNETFRSMINRTANRCGEFLYWHDGSLQFGLHNAFQTKEISSQSYDISYAVESDYSFSNFEPQQSHRSGTSKVNDDVKGAFNYDLETGMPDFSETLNVALGDRGLTGYDNTRLYGSIFGLKYFTDPSKTDTYNTIDKEKSDSMTYVIGKFLSDYAKSGYFIDFVSGTFTDIAATSFFKKLSDARDADAEKAKKNNKRFGNDEGDNFGFIEKEQTNFADKISDGKVTIESNSPKEYDENELKYKFAPFSTLKDIISDVPHNLFDGKTMGNDFYAKIRKYGTQSANQAVDIVMLTSASLYNVGDRIFVNGNTYIITSIHADIHESAKSGDDCIKIHAIPSVYSYNSRNFFMPEPLPEQNRIMDGNSTAVVTDNEDPYGQGRVRVRFNWQGSNDVALTADDLQECIEQALKDNYSPTALYIDNQKSYEADKASQLLLYKNVIALEIINKKIEDENAKRKKAGTDSLTDAEKALIVPEDADKFKMYMFDGKVYPKTVADEKKKYYDDNKKPTDPLKEITEEAEHTWKEITDLEAKLKAVVDAKAAYEAEKLKSAQIKELKKDSTPWIRMASPMASEKAKMFMKPEVNDEVIIGFENGNPERPYVIGSLYNGTAKTPSSAYSIIGNNGQSITIDNENIAISDLVGKLISPAVKTLMDKAIDSEKDNVSKKDIPVGGKITLKDKYGFYNLSMSSADRKIDIKSPLGDISISAFTGITLSAPNGDINIKGKNVNITAGDKVSIVSGTNKDIRSVSATEMAGIITKMATDIATSAMKTFVGEYKVVDLSLIRSVWEVVFRPLNGTMLVQSKHHLLLQAGKGNAEIPIDAISVKDAHHAIDANPNYPYYLMKEYIKTFVTSRVDTFKNVEQLYNKTKMIVEHAREDTDLDNDGVTPAIFTRVLTENPNLDYVHLSKKKVLQILKECVEDNGNNGYKIKENDLYKLCPIPTGSLYAIATEQWKNNVKATAQLVTDFANALNLFHQIKGNNSSFMNTLAGKSFLKAMNNAFTEKREWSQFKKLASANEFTGSITFTPTIKEGNQGQNVLETSFTVTNFIGDAAALNKFKAYIFNSEVATDKVYYEFIKVLEYFCLVYYIPEGQGQDIKIGKRRYKVADLPEWDNTNNCVTGYNPHDVNNAKTFQQFLSRIMPATQVDPVIGGGAIGTLVKDAAAGIVNDMLDSKNLNWMWHHERNLWGALTHPGYILMSDEKGAKTVTLTNDGEFKANGNNSIASLLSDMGKPAIPATDVATADEMNNEISFGGRHLLRYNRKTIKEHLNPAH